MQPVSVKSQEKRREGRTSGTRTEIVAAGAWRVSININIKWSQKKVFKDFSKEKIESSVPITGIEHSVKIKQVEVMVVSLWN